MKLGEIIQRLGILAKLSEDAVEEDSKGMGMIMVDGGDVKALRETVDLLETLHRILLAEEAKGDGEE